MNLFRSEDMRLIRITMQRETSHDAVEELGKSGLIQFYDLSSNLNAFQRQFSHEVRRCEELQRILRFFNLELEKIKEQGGVFFPVDSKVNKMKLDVDSLEGLFREYEKELKEINSTTNSLKTKKNKSEELLQVIAQGGNFFQIEEGDGSETSSAPLLQTREGGLKSVVGVIPRSKMNTFLLLVNRATRGNAITRFVPIEEALYDEASKTEVEKNVFVVFSNSEKMKEKIEKVCETIGASIHVYPSENITEAHQKLQNEINDLENTITQTEEAKLRRLNIVSNNMAKWEKYVMKEKAVFNAMNMFDYSIKNSVYCEGWVPKKGIGIIREIIEKADAKANAQVSSYIEELETEEEPPTYFSTNRFTESAQAIVNAYGTPRYKEVNPNILSLVTFPFLFAIMYGDAGHGTILFVVAFCLCVFEKKIKAFMEASDIFGMLFSGRYVLLLMAIFSIYCGIIYNDAFSLAFNLFGTAYEFNEDGIGSRIRRTYPFGVDPAWYGTKNKLLYYNSLKMKLAVLFGVAQMLWGLLFSAFNHVYFKKIQNVFFEFLPMVVILCSSFGYMCWMIIYKWCTDWYIPGYERAPPNLLNTMTKFFISIGEVPEGEELFPYQYYVQVSFLALWAISIPWLFISKPTYLIIRNNIRNGCKKKGKGYDEKLDSDDDGEDHVPVSINAVEVEDVQLSEDVLKREDQIVIDDSKKKKDLKKNEDDNKDDDDDDDVDIVGTKKEGTEKSKLIVKKNEKGGHHHDDDHDERDHDNGTWDEIVIHQVIHAIEFILGTISHTASYLRLWALSLAHAQLSDVFWNMSMNLVLKLDLSSIPILDVLIIRSGIGVTFSFGLWLGLTTFVLLMMEALSCLLHALRLHWVEFQSKFFFGDGEEFEAFSLVEKKEE